MAVAATSTLVLMTGRWLSRRYAALLGRSFASDMGISNSSLFHGQRGLSRTSRRSARQLLRTALGQAAVAEPLAAGASTASSNLAVIREAVSPDGSVNPDFVEHKKRILERTLLFDKSPKGSVDVRCLEILHEINHRQEFITTSSCSGRVLFMAYERNRDNGAVLPGKHTKAPAGGHLRASHDGIENALKYFSLETEPLRRIVEEGGDIWLNVMPFTLDVACASPADARRLVLVAQQVFHRGAAVISPNREWRTVVGLHGNQRMEMPFVLGGQPVYCGSLEALQDIVNGKLERNWVWMERFLECLRRDL